MSLFTVMLSVLVAWSGPGPRPQLPDDPVPACGKALSRPFVDAESTHSYDVRHYRLDFDLPMDNAGYECHEQVSLVSREPGLDTVVLDFDGLVCDSVQQDCEPLPFSTGSGFLTIELSAPLPQGDSTLLDIFFHRDSATQQIGWFFGQPPRIRHAHGMTCGCPRDNHYWFACWDHPMDKADRGCMMNFTLPDTFQTCANGVLDSVTTNTDGTKTWWWNHRYPIATYLMTFSASRFATWGTTFVNTNPAHDTIPIQHWVWPVDSSASRQGYRRVPEMMEYYIDTLVYGPYPFDKFGHVPGYFGFPWGGMEHQTLVMLHTSYTNGGGDVTIAHELSHMWWGDMVTHVGYADVWLNEGFATYSECICMGALNGRNYFNTLIRARAGSYFSSDRSGRMPVYDPPWPRIYDYGHIYCKGAWVQHMLRYVIGDTVWGEPGIFFTGMRAYGDSFKYGTVSTEDYKNVLETVSGKELDWFFDEWIYQAGYPKYSLDWTQELVGDSVRVVTTLTQNNGSQAPDFFRTPLPLLISCLYVDTLVYIHPEANPQVDTFLVGQCVDSLTVDPDNWVLDSAYLTGIAEGGHQQPVSRILGATPNPGQGRIRFQVSGPPGSSDGVTVFDETGRQVANLPFRTCGNGRAEVNWNRSDDAGRAVPAGIYFCRLSADESGPLKLVLLD